MPPGRAVPTPLLLSMHYSYKYAIISVSVMRVEQGREGVSSLPPQHPEQSMVVLNSHSFNTYSVPYVHIIEQNRHRTLTPWSLYSSVGMGEGRENFKINMVRKVSNT